MGFSRIYLMIYGGIQQLWTDVIYHFIEHVDFRYFKYRIDKVMLEFSIIATTVTVPKVIFVISSLYVIVKKELKYAMF